MMKLIIRILIDIALLIFIIHGWWYFAVFLCIVGIWNFRFYIECIIAGLFYDSIFGPTTRGIEGSIGLIVSTVIFLATFGVKGVLRITE